jgi:hypothetical protein
MLLDSIHYLNAAIGDYIFLIVIILASIIQAISQNRKKAEIAKAEQQKTREKAWQDEEIQEDKHQEMTQEESPLGSFFDEMEKVFIPELPDNEQSGGGNGVPDQEIVNQQADNPALNSNITEAELQKELHKDYSVIDKIQQSKEANPVVRKRILAAGFDLKKAIIYSEILNRKYS